MNQSMHPSEAIKHITKNDLNGMNVLFINMPLRESALPNTMPQGVVLLATILRDNYDVKCSVIDLNGYRIKDQDAEKRNLKNGRHLTKIEARELIKKHIEINGQPDLVGLSGKITTLIWQQVVVSMIRKILPDVFIVCGNGLATELKTGLFHYIPQLDAVSHSEGDDVIVKIAYDANVIKQKGIKNAINSGKLKPYYLGEIAGRHRFMYEGNRPKDLDSILFADYSFLKEDVNGFNMLEYYIGNAIWGSSANNSSATSFSMQRSTNFVSSRGCPFACVVPHTLISTPEGSKKIKDLKEGDMVLGYDETSKNIQPTKIVKTHKVLDATYIIEMQDSSNLEISAEHPVYTRRGWVNVSQLTEADNILKNVPYESKSFVPKAVKSDLYLFGWIKIKKITKPDEQEMVHNQIKLLYNLTCSPIDNYFANDLLVHNCSFCFRGSQGERNYGIRSAENLALEFNDHKQKYNVDFIGMPDDNFAVNYQRIKDLVPLLQPLRMRWGTHLRLDEAAGIKSRQDGNIITENPKRIDLMAQAGCVYIGFGAESASSKVLLAMNKGGFILKNGMEKIKVNGINYEFPLSMTQGIRNCLDAGIHANCTWIMGYPQETLEDLKISIAFIKWQEELYNSYGIDTTAINHRMFTATWYPGTAMGHVPKVKKMLEDVFNVKTDTQNNPIVDDAYYKYLVELDDATKLLYNPQTNEPLNFGDMPQEQFIKARNLIDEGKIFEVLNL